MIPSYHRPTSVENALELKKELGAEAVYLAGGTEVNNALASRPTALIDLAGLGLDRVKCSADGITIGAGVTFQMLLEHPDIPGYIKAAVGQMANRNIRNRATVGGHLGNNRACADLIPTLLAAQATVKLADRQVAVDQFLAGTPGLILSVFIPASDRSFGLCHMTRTASDISIIATSVSLKSEAGKALEPIIAMGGVAPHVIRLFGVEKRLDGQPLPPTERLEELIARAVNPIDDIRGSAAYKRHLAGVLGARALEAAVQKAGSTEGGC